MEGAEPIACVKNLYMLYERLTEVPYAVFYIMASAGDNSAIPTSSLNDHEVLLQTGY